MAKERRDSKNRILWKGEHQKSDGRYMYRYTDSQGEARYVYSWTLTKSDRTPKGKTPGPCLRDMEKEIAKDLQDGINTYNANNVTLNDYFELYLKQKTNLKQATRRHYRQNYDVNVRNRIGNRKIATLRYSDIRQCYLDILKEREMSVATLANIDSVLKPVMKMAKRDCLIRDNPVDGVLGEIKKEKKETVVKKEALTIKQQEAFIDYISNNKAYSRWKTLFTVMLGTGCRIGELCGLTWDDCDFTENVIHIKRTLCYSPDEYTGKYTVLIQSPKTSSGVRSIPMLKDVRDALLKERIRQMKDGFCQKEIDGVSGFVFSSRSGNFLIPRSINSLLNRVVASYNEEEAKRAMAENRDAILLPQFSPHILRHTFCTRMCESGMDVKVIQAVMGHAQISVTMDVYTSVTEEHKAISFSNAEGRFRIS